MSTAALPSSSVVAATGGTGVGDESDRSQKKLKASCEGGDPPSGSGKRKKEKIKGADGKGADDSTPVPCPVCAKIFFSVNTLYGHMRLHPERSWRGLPLGPASKDTEMSASLVLLSEADGGEDPPQPLFQCSACKRVFLSRQALGGHRASHRRVKGCYAIEQERRGELERGSSNQAQAEWTGVSAEEDDKKYEQVEQVVMYQVQGEEKKIAEEDAKAKGDEETEKLSQQTNEGYEEAEHLNLKRDGTDERKDEEAENLTGKNNETNEGAEEKKDEEPESQIHKRDEVAVEKLGPSSPVGKRPVFDLNLPPPEESDGDSPMN